jgi:hypothetical protein
MRKLFKTNDDADSFYSSLANIDEKTSSLIYCEDRKVLRLLQALGETCLAIANSKGVIYSCNEEKRLECNDLGEQLLSIMKNGMIDRVDSIIPVSRFNPLVRLALDAIHAKNASYFARNLKVHEKTEKLEIVVKVLNEVVDDIRKGAGSDDFKRVLKNYKRGAEENRKKLSQLVDEMFCIYSKVLVVRVDLSYKRASPAYLCSDDVTHMEARSDLKTLLKDMKTKLFKSNYITYVWKLEYGPLKGYHYHAFFFFDGSKVRADVELARKIGEHWSTIVTKGRGWYFNCNACKNHYPSPAIGMIEHSNLIKIANLKNKALEYLMKVDHFVRQIADEKIRTFGKGAISKKIDKKRGRPRIFPQFGIPHSNIRMGLKVDRV